MYNIVSPVHGVQKTNIYMAAIDITVVQHVMDIPNISSRYVCNLLILASMFEVECLAFIPADGILTDVMKVNNI